MIATFFYPVGFMLATLGLVFWFFVGDSAKAKIFKSLLFGGIGLYLVGVLFAGIGFSDKLGIMFRDLMVIGVTGMVFQFLAGRKSAFLTGVAVLLIGLLWYNKNVLRQSLIASSDIELASEGELLVELKEGTSITALQNILNQYNLKAERAFFPEDAISTDLDDYYLIDIPENQRRHLAAIKAAINASNQIDWLEENETILVAPLPGRKLPEINKKFGLNDPGLENLWGFQAMEMDRLYDFLDEQNIKPKKQALIAILDTGVDAEHEDLKANFKSIDASANSDPMGHGTHCAGIAGAVSNNGIGVASFSRTNKYTQITSVRVLNNYGMGTQQTIIKGILKAADQGADVISLSLGGRSNQSRQEAYRKAVKYANKKGAIVVAAAGNANRNAKEFAPVNAQGVIGVSAVDDKLQRAVFSNYVNDLELGIAAPGVNIFSTIPESKYASFNGTSMATPYAAGLLGLMKSIRPEITTREAYRLIQENGKKTTNPKETGAFIFPVETIRALVK
ncbi:MAG: hypothetical protein DHS20C18_16520 [Saprospiraceae bacterium]|nr:MAG: hypothetical protein DHS20C18_16520 [Saprospiraceae bacterium]